MHSTEPRTLVLHGLRLRGFGEAEDVSALTSLDADTVTRLLSTLDDDGLVLHRDGRLPGWALTRAGRDEQERLLAAELDATGCRSVVADGYARFLELNQGLLEICTDWQVRDDAPNDHADTVYDKSVIDRLGAVHAQVVPILTDLAGCLERFAGYRPRLDTALDRLQSGELDWFTRPMIDSYHTVWFQLHEDLLNTLGIERTAESPA